MTDLIKIIKSLGLSEKASKVYLACLELGEATVQDLAKKAGLKRTTIYYTLEELQDAGALIETERNKKTYYVAEQPRTLLKRVKEKLWDFEQSLESLEEKKHSVFKRPRSYYLYGPSGFKQIWEMILAEKNGEFRLITDSQSFEDFVSEKYIANEIIKTKRLNKIFSKQIIQDSPFAKKIVARDKHENRVSKILPPTVRIPFTEVICKDFVAFISPRLDNTLLIIENELFAQTRRALFEIMWDGIK